MSQSIAALIERGGVYHDLEGNDTASVFKSILERVSFPVSVDRLEVIKALLEREKVLSTAVGGGIALPHPKHPLIKSRDEECIIVCFLKQPVSMNAPDGRPVNVLFILLSSSQISHIQTLTTLAKIFRKDDFKRILSTKPLKAQLVSFLDRMTFDI